MKGRKVQGGYNPEIKWEEGGTEKSERNLRNQKCCGQFPITSTVCIKEKQIVKWDQKHQFILENNNVIIKSGQVNNGKN